MATNDRVQEILEDTKERLKREMPGQHFFFLLMPVYPEQMALLGEDGRVQVQKRLVQHLKQEINRAIVDQQRET
jgi:hypothetical protein